MSCNLRRTTPGVMGQSSFTGDGNIQRESTVSLYSRSTATTAGGRTILRTEFFVDALLLHFGENIFRFGVAIVIVANDDAPLPTPVLALPYSSVSSFSFSCHGFNSFPKMSSIKPPTMPQAVFCISEVTWV